MPACCAGYSKYIAYHRTYIQWLWQPRTTQPPEQPQPGGHFSVKLLLCKVARQRHPCVSASLRATLAASVRAIGGRRRLRNWEAEIGEAEWGQSTKLLVLKMAWGFYGSGKRFRSRLGSLSSMSTRVSMNEKFQVLHNCKKMAWHFIFNIWMFYRILDLTCRMICWKCKKSKSCRFLQSSMPGVTFISVTLDHGLLNRKLVHD